MKPHKHDFEGNLGNIMDAFNKLESEEDYKEFYSLYWDLVEETISKEQNISAGMRRPIGETYYRVFGNISYLLGNVNEMRANYARKIWWFLK